MPEVLADELDELGSEASRNSISMMSHPVARLHHGRTKANRHTPERGHQMQIRTRFSMSADGYVTTREGWPPLTVDPHFVSGQSHGFPEFQSSCEAVLMGRTTFEPALSNDRWPWPNLDVFVLGSDVPTHGASSQIVTDSDPARLLDKLRAANRGKDVHLVGGPQTIETFRALGALDKLGLLVLPFFLGEGMRLTPSLSSDIGLALESERSLPEGAVEIVYACT